jgi:hypothetical protein
MLNLWRLHKKVKVNLSLCQEDSPFNYAPYHEDVLKVYLHASTALPMAQESSEPVGEAGWAPEPVWTRWRREKNIPSLPLTGIEPRSSIP